MATTLGGSNIQYPDNSIQTTKSPLIKTRYTTWPNYNLSLPTWGTETDTSPVVDMGVPAASTNWYRCEYYSVRDDWPSSGNGGMGMAYIVGHHHQIGLDVMHKVNTQIMTMTQVTFIQLLLEYGIYQFTHHIQRNNTNLKLWGLNIQDAIFVYIVALGRIIVLAIGKIICSL